MKAIIKTNAGGLNPLRFGSTRGLMEQINKRCDGQHDIYVAEVIHVGAEGKIVVVTVCRQCDSVHFHERQVHEPHHEAILLKEKEK